MSKLTTHAGPLDNTTEVETPERIRFRYHVAGPTLRCLAYLLDALIRILIFISLIFAMRLGASGVGADELEELGQGLILITLFGLEWGYYVLFETLWNGRTPGKRALGLRVVKEGGQAINFIDSVLRNLLRAADFLPMGYIAGILSMAADRRFRRLGDRVAGTMVVVEESMRVEAAYTLHPPPQPEELAALPGRPPLTAFERESIEMLLRRRYLSQARRLELAEMIAAGLARRMHMAEAALPGGNAVRFLALLHIRAQPQNREPPTAREAHAGPRP